MWAVAVQTPPLSALLARAGDVRVSGCCASTASRRPRSRSRCSRSRRTGVALDGLEITTCLRRGEIEIATVFAPAAEPRVRRARRRDPRAPRRHAVLRGRRDHRRDRRRAAQRAHDRGRRVVHRRADGRPPDRPRGIQRLRARRRRRLLQRGEGRVRRRAGGADRAPRRGLPRGRGRARRRGRGALRGRRRRSASPGSPDPTAGRRDKPVGMVCLSVTEAGGGRLDRTVQLPGDRAMVRERTTTVVMHLLRRLLA